MECLQYSVIIEFVGSMGRVLNLVISGMPSIPLTDNTLVDDITEF